MDSLHLTIIGGESISHIEIFARVRSSDSFRQLTKIAEK